MESVVGFAEDFKALEKAIYEKHCANARAELQAVLEKADQKLAAKRDRSRFRHKGRRKTTLRTIMGEVEITRSMYLDQEEKRPGEKKHVFLLDQLLGMCTIGKMSVNLAGRAVEHCLNMSFRKAAEILNTYTSQHLSHQAVWEVLQTAGERVEKQEEQLVREFRMEDTTGNRQVPVLFEEADGVYLAIQKRDRKVKKRTSMELKIGVAYEGWEKRHPRATHYRTVGKLVYAGFMKGQNFHKTRNAVVGSKYDLDEVKVRVLNGDGASWISNDIDSGTEIFQLDPYHLHRAVCRAVRDKKVRPHILRWIRTGQLDKVKGKLEALKWTCDGIAAPIKRLEALWEYLENNKDGLQSWRDRPGMASLEPPEGLEYRTLGTMERTVEIFDRRMDGPLSWSPRGAGHMAKLLARKVSGTLDETLAGIWEYRDLRKLERNADVPVRNTQCCRTKRRLGTSAGSWKIRQGQIPYAQSSVTIGRRIIRNLFNYREFGDMGFQ